LQTGAPLKDSNYKTYYVVEPGEDPAGGYTDY